MQFTYSAYRDMIKKLKNNGYKFANYENYVGKNKVVIMRHDIDYSIDKAVVLAKLEHAMNIKSTYFVMLSSQFYNLISKKELDKLKQIKEYGHDIGLHFDELNYTEEYYELNGGVFKSIFSEVDMIKHITGIDIKFVSMHRPSQKTLDADYDLSPLINTYGKQFFKEFKYLSDSRRKWRENIDTILNDCKYNKLHILTHAFWYNSYEKDLKTSLLEFIKSADNDRYNILMDNFTDLTKVIDTYQI